MPRKDLPPAVEVAQQLRAVAFATSPLEAALGDTIVDGVASIERIFAWADGLSKAVDPSDSLRLASGPAMEPATLWALAHLFENANAPERAAEVLSSPRLATSNQEIEAFRLLCASRVEFARSNWAAASAALRHAVNLTESPSLLRKSANLAERIIQASPFLATIPVRLAIVGDATFTGYVAPLKAYAFARRLRLQLHLGDYGQHFQELQSAESSLARFKPTIIAISLSWRSIGVEENQANPDWVVQRVVDSCKELWNLALRRGCSRVIQHNFEIPESSAYGRLSASMPGGRDRILHLINLELAVAASGTENVSVLDIDQIAGALGKRAWSDARMWTAAKHYPGSAGAALIARHYIAIARAVHGAPSKCLVLDLDNTLWGGVIGEDGVDGIRLGGTGEGEAFVEFQRFVKSLATRGILLAVASKNDDAAARSPFTEHPDMVLQLEDFAAFVANWRPKHENLREIASELNIGIDSLVFVDDNPSERMSIRAMLPEVDVPEVGADPSGFAAIISRTLAFEALSLTQEDLGRAASYQSASARRELEGTSSTMDEYLARLGMTLTFAHLDDVTLPRAVQLIGKTNQFNLLTSRMGNAKVRTYMDATHYTRLVRLADQFTDHGITGLMLATVADGALHIDEWLLSCRILGRRVEDAMFAAVWNFAHRAGIGLLRASFRPTAKNGQVADLYDRLGMQLDSQTGGSKLYVAEVNALREMPACFALIEQPSDTISVAGSTQSFTEVERVG